MDMHFLMLTGATETKFEKVDQFTWDNYGRALTREGESRYVGYGFQILSNGGLVRLRGTFTKAELAIITRIAGAEGQAPQKQANGFWTEPEYIKFKTAKGSKIHEVEREQRAA